MRQNQQETITVEQVINYYTMLSSSDPQSRFKANQFLCALPHRDQAWNMAQTMITTVQDLNFQFLGSQILYQKVSSEIKNLTPEQKLALREFVFTKLGDQHVNNPPTIDKLASIGALIGTVQILGIWKSFVADLVSFMGQNLHNLRSGLFVIQRIPQQMRNTNRYPSGQKLLFIDEVLKNQELIARIFQQVLNMGNDQLTKKCLQAMESWAKSRFNFLKYSAIITKVLSLSLTSFDYFELAITMIIQTIKGATVSRLTMGTPEWSPAKEAQRYSKQQLQSIGIIIQYVGENQNNFKNNNIDSEYVDVFLEIIKQALLGFGFLIGEAVGFNLLQILLYYTKSKDLRTSFNTFEFWSDYCQKMGKCNTTPQIKNNFLNVVNQVFKIVSQKVAVDCEQLLTDPDLKQQATVDDANTMSWDQYRKSSYTLYQYLYNYYLSVTGSPKYYFDKCFQFIGNQANTNLGVGTQLALFCVKAPIQSMISDMDAQMICKFINFVINKGTNVYARISVQTLLLIRDCTREIKRDNNLCMNALNYSLYYLNDEKVCHYAAQAFKILMQTLTTISDHNLVINLLKYYSSQEIPNQHIVDKVIEGIVTAIVKLQNSKDIGNYIYQLMQIVLNRFQKAHNNLKPIDQKPYLISMLEMKTILDNFQSSGKALQQRYQQYIQLYSELLRNSLSMVMIVLPYCLKQKINYVKFNQLGLSCSMYKLALKLCNNQITNQFLLILDQTLTILNKQQLTEKFPLLELISSTFTFFINKNNQLLNNWIKSRMEYINNFYIEYMKNIVDSDPDVLRAFYEIQQSLVLYNYNLYLMDKHSQQIFNKALYILRHVNQTKMQRKIVNFLFVCCQIQQVFYPKFPQVVQTIIGSIPIINGIAHHNLSRMFLITAQNIPNIRQILTKLLRSNPYEGLNQTLIQLLVNLIMLTIDQNPNVTINVKQRCFMMIIKDLVELANNSEIPNKTIQLQFRYNQWKKNKFITNEDA